ncbi:MAG: AMP-binding protein, partial [Pseudomonadales bacterium]
AQNLQTRASSLAQLMAARYPAGSVISFMLPNWNEAAIIYLAATMAGLIAHPVLPSLREHELGFMLNDVGCRMIFIPDEYRGHDYSGMLSAVTKQMDHGPQVVTVRAAQNGNSEHTHFESLFDGKRSASLAAPEPDAVRMIMYTSGTTGRPKGVMHSHNSLHALIQQIGEHWLIDKGDKFLVASPISHIGGSIYAFECPLLLGTTAVLMERWDATDAIAKFLSEQCTHFAGATPFLVQMLAAARAANTRLPHLKLFICGGASVPPSLIREAAGYFEHAAVTRVYGSTEVPVTTVGVVKQSDLHHAAETDGQIGIASVAIVDSNGVNAETGEVVALGPQMLVGYVHAEDEENAFLDNGFYRTGDLGRWVDNDYLLIDGRAKDIIIRHGENIAPKELEDLLLEHPDISEVAIVGLPDEKTGERACAVLVAANAAAPDLDDVRSYLNDKGVAKFKIPEQVVVWGALPKNDAGKVLKHQIRATILA